MASCDHDFPFGIMDVASLLNLRTRRRVSDSVYVDCPFCNDNRGKMNIHYAKNVFRCNYCGESGGMVALYARLYHISNSDAYREICEALNTGSMPTDYVVKPKDDLPPPVENALRADANAIHQTYSMLLSFLTLSESHRSDLLGRGLTDEQIERFGYKTTPPPYLCKSYTERLLKQGCVVKGVPGFYLDGDGKWTVKFHKRTSGIIIPIRGIDGLVQGAQIRLDTPLKNEADASKGGAKYIWLSSVSKYMGVTSGSPVHFVGDPFANAIYVTEGALKGDVAHSLMNRSFVCVAGANNLGQLEPLFALLAKSGTTLIVEAHDMDKFSNKMIDKGASRICALAQQHGMEARRLTWNPNYKGVDDWQLALKHKNQSQNKKEVKGMNFKDRFLAGLCDLDAIEDSIAAWHSGDNAEQPLRDYLGLTEDEYALFLNDGDLKTVLLAQRRTQRFRVYQLELGEKPTPWAFCGISAMHNAGYEQPPSSEYRLVHESELPTKADVPEAEILELIFHRYNDRLPKDYCGRSISPSDVIELYDDGSRRYYYCDAIGFTEVKFSPKFAQPMRTD